MSLFLSSVCFILGLMLIIKGGDLFVDAAAWMAKVSGIPPVIVGATIVSLATTLPEIIVSLLAAGQGKADMAIGNAIGSVTANQGLILGISLLFAPLVIRRRDYALKGGLLLSAVACLLFFSTHGTVSAVASMLLLSVFLLFMTDSIRSAKRSAHHDVLHLPVTPGDAANMLARFFLGTAGIIWGAHLLVKHGSILALKLGIPEAVVGVTLMAVGTSLPELVTAVTALTKDEASLSVGNIIGANLIDTTLILPLCALVSRAPLPFSTQSLLLDLPVCLLISAAALLPALVQGKFSRWQGALLLSLYLGYIILLLA